MDYESIDEFEQETPRRPQRDLRENSRTEEKYQGRPVRRQASRPQEGFGPAGDRGQPAGRSGGTGRLPGNRRQTEAFESQGTRRTSPGVRQPGQGRPPGTGRLPKDLGEKGIRTDRQPGNTGGAVRQPGTGRVPQVQNGIRGTSGARRAAAREAAAASETGTGRLAGAAGTGKIRRQAGTAAQTETPREALAQAKIQRAKQKKRRRRIIAMIVAECLTLTVILTYAYFARRLNMIQREDFNKEDVRNEALSVDDITKMKGYWMIAVFGVDSRSTNVGAGVQADVNMICCINQDTGDIKLVSVYRDTYLNINDSNSYRKINAAYTNGGPEQALKALNKNLDLDITDYVTFSWKAVAEGINILGGVDVEITKSEFRFINAFITETVQATNIGSHQLPSAGLHHLDGVQAVAYGRLRLMDTDYARTERQRKIIELAFAKAKEADYPTLNNILVTTLPSISTNLDFADLTNLALSISKYHIGETAGFPFAKGNANIPGKGDCVIPQTLESNVSQLHAFLFGDEDYTPTEKVRQISSKIAADSGMYKEGKASTGSALPTDSNEPESTARATTQAPTEEETRIQEETESTRALETDGNGNMILYPGMTDEDGNLIDAPIDDWPEGPEDVYPGGSNNNQTGYGPQGSSSSTRPGETESRTPGSTAPAVPETRPSSSESSSPDQSAGPGGGPGSTSSASETVSSGGTSGSTNPSAGGPSGTRAPDTGTSGTEAGGEIGPGLQSQPSSAPTTASPESSHPASEPAGQAGPGGGESEEGPQGPGL